MQDAGQGAAARARVLLAEDDEHVQRPLSRSLSGAGYEVVAVDNGRQALEQLLAAWAVLVSHSFAVLDQPEPLHQLGSTLGNVGVLIFFAVSGLLIRRSWEYDPSPRDFWVKRGLRLLPALATVGVLTAFVLGPLVTTSSPSAGASVG